MGNAENLIEEYKDELLRIHAYQTPEQTPTFGHQEQTPTSGHQEQTPTSKQQEEIPRPRQRRQLIPRQGIPRQEIPRQGIPRQSLPKVSIQVPARTPLIIPTTLRKSRRIADGSL